MSVKRNFYAFSETVEDKEVSFSLEGLTCR